jgi:hypothetical protein
MITFASPSSGGGTVLKPADIEGHLLVVEPVEFIERMTTSLGESDAVSVTVHDITAQESHESVLWFSRVLVSSLKGRIGEKVLAVMGKGDAKPGQSAPWILKDASSEPKAVKAATDYLVKNLADQMSPTAADPANLDADELVAALAELGAKPVK